MVKLYKNVRWNGIFYRKNWEEQAACLLAAGAAVEQLDKAAFHQKLGILMEMINLAIRQEGRRVCTGIKQ